MKKISSFLLVTIFSALIITNFSSCEKLKPQNLKAGQHLKQANKYYSEEKFKKAVEEYTAALELNPNLKGINFLLATGYANLYKPGRTSEKNAEYGNNAIEYLKKAEAEDPENEKIVMAKGELYDKLATAQADEAKKEEFYKEAEQAYLALMEKDKTRAATYYILANFYMKHGKADEAEKTFKARIALDPNDPEGYSYYAGHLQNSGRNIEANGYHMKKFYATVNKEILAKQTEIDGIQEKVDAINKKLDYIEKHLRKNRNLKRAQKKQMIADKEAEIAEIGDIKELTAQVDGLKKERDEMIVKAEEEMLSYEEEKKKELAQTFYTMGANIFAKCHRTSPEMMGPKERLEFCTEGQVYLDKALKLDENYREAMFYKRMLYSQMAIAEPMKRDQYSALIENITKDIKRASKKIKEAEAYKKQLEQMGE